MQGGRDTPPPPPPLTTATSSMPHVPAMAASWAESVPAVAPQRLLFALQPPATDATRAPSVPLRPQWTHHTSSGSGSSSSSSQSNVGGVVGARSGGSSSPRYSDLLDAINEANVVSAVSYHRPSEDWGNSSAATAREAPMFANDRRFEFRRPSLSDRNEERAPAAFKSPHTQPAARKLSGSSPSSYPLAPKADGTIEEGQTNPPKKRVRYLRDTDRRNIIRRIENGEKQAALAREFGVTRAAICHIKKNRYEIISRYDMLVQTAKEMDKQESIGIPPGADAMVHEVRSKAVLLLLTTLRDRHSPPSLFRRTAGRLIMMLLEEAISSIETEAVEVTTTVGKAFHGLQTKHQFCGVGIGSEGLPFLVLFNQMEPDAPKGSLQIEQVGDGHGPRSWHVDRTDLPHNIAQMKVLLFISTCRTGGSVCKAVEVLRESGVDERNISIVMLWCAAEGLVAICNRFPDLKVVTAAIDNKTDQHGPEGLGDFILRYNGR